MAPANARAAPPLGLALALLLAAGLPRGAPAQSAPHGGPDRADRFAPLSAPVLTGAERSRLDAGEIATRDLPPSDDEGIGLLIMGVVDASPEALWRIMADCEEQDEFLPRVTYAVVRDRDGDSHTCELVVDLPFPLEDLRSVTRHHVRRLPDGGYQRRWELLPGDSDYRRDTGSWSVHPYPHGRSLLVHRMDLLPKSAVPSWLLRAAQTYHAQAIYDAIRLRVREGPVRAKR